MKNLKIFFLTLLSTTIILSCDDDDDTPAPINEEETITTLILTLEERNNPTAQPIEFSFQDLGAGTVTIADGFTLTANANYRATVQVLDETDPNDVEDITEEVEEEDDEHQFFYLLPNSNITVLYNDSDDDGNPIGIETTFDVGAAESGTMTVTLLHEPDKDAAGVSDGDPTNAGGETDISVNFNYDVQ